MTKLTVLLIGILFLGVLSAGFISAEMGKITAYVIVDNKDTKTVENSSVNSNASLTPMPGGDRDVHGCIPSAGYTWCEEKSKCLRIWEENCSGIVNPFNNSIKILPETASARAEEVLGAKCEQRNCTLIIKNIQTTNGSRSAFEISAEKPVKILGFISANMPMQVYVDSENNQLLGSKKPWWAFLAGEF